VASATAESVEAGTAAPAATDIQKGAGGFTLAGAAPETIVGFIAADPVPPTATATDNSITGGGLLALAGAASETTAGLGDAADPVTTAEMVAASSTALIGRFGSAIDFLRSFKWVQ
jgi:hypothetical protein